MKLAVLPYVNGLPLAVYAFNALTAKCLPRDGAFLCKNRVLGNPLPPVKCVPHEDLLPDPELRT